MPKERLKQSEKSVDNIACVNIYVYMCVHARSIILHCIFDIHRYSSLKNLLILTAASLTSLSLSNRGRTRSIKNPDTMPEKLNPVNLIKKNEWDGYICSKCIFTATGLIWRHRGSTWMSHVVEMKYCSPDTKTSFFLSDELNTGHRPQEMGNWVMEDIRGMTVTV